MKVVKREWRDERGVGGSQDFECFDLDSAHPDEPIAYTCDGGRQVELAGNQTAWTLERARQISWALDLLLDTSTQLD
jgi:hypothetical protein